MFDNNADDLGKTLMILQGEKTELLEKMLTKLPVTTKVISRTELEAKIEDYKNLDPVRKQMKMDAFYTQSLTSGEKLIIINIPDLDQENLKIFKRFGLSNGFNILEISGTLQISKESPLAERYKEEAEFGSSKSPQEKLTFWQKIFKPA